MTVYENHPKADLLVGAQEAIARYAADGVKAEVFFKASCPCCDERCMFQEPNLCFDEMECCGCGLTFPFVEGNYMVKVEL